MPHLQKDQIYIEGLTNPNPILVKILTMSKPGLPAKTIQRQYSRFYTRTNSTSTAFE
jgi:hypothetical protein